MSNEPEVPATPVPLVVEVLPNTTDETVTMSKDALNKLITSKMGKAGADARAEAEKLRLENQRLKEVAAGQGSQDELERVRGELASSKLEQAAILEASVKRQRDLVIAQESSKHGFIDVDTLQRWTRQNLRHNATTGSFEVIADDGTPVLNAAQEPISVTDFFADYASKKLWLVRGSVKSGGGGTSSSGTPAPTTLPLSHYFGPGSNASAVNALSINRPSEYRRMRLEAIRQNLIAGSN
jgi:hypothetical protein